MTKKETLMLMSYIYNIRSRAEHEVRQLQSNIRYSRIDIVDCSELASAITRAETTHEITENILMLLNLADDESP